MNKIKEFFIGFKHGQKLFGESLSVIVNTLLLIIVYIIGVGLTSIFAKICKKHFLDLKPINKESYWEEFNLSKKPLEEYYRQF
ncbi:MAG: hypothetical protein Q8N99_06685 [Nanoarchaeota archaeon]|nr:hypothetical protein [Nanoarchaeota archaeon]